MFIIFFLFVLLECCYHLLCDFNKKKKSQRYKRSKYIISLRFVCLLLHRKTRKHNGKMKYMFFLFESILLLFKKKFTRCIVGLYKVCLKNCVISTAMFFPFVTALNWVIMFSTARNIYVCRQILQPATY
jgi:hypothetical protein